MSSGFGRAGLLLTCVLGAVCCSEETPVPGAHPESAEAAAGPESDPFERYIADYLRHYPARATAAGWFEQDGALGRFDAASLDAWVERNRQAARDFAALEAGGASLDDRLDARLVRRQAELEIFDHERLEVHRHQPLWWLGILSRANVHLLVREDRPAVERLSFAASRAEAIPRVVDEAMAALGGGDPARIAAEHCELAAGQTRALAAFYREGFRRALPDEVAADAGDLGERLTRSGAAAADALERLGASLDELAARATGSFRLGSRYAERFRLVTGEERAPREILAAAERALAEKQAEAGAFARRVWSSAMPGTPRPERPLDAARILFERLADDHAATVDAFVQDYRRLVDRAVEFVEEHEVVSLPGAMTLYTGPSPGYLAGASVGGVYPAGPFRPDAQTLFLLPTPPEHFDRQQRDAFFRDFNHHFNVMIVPHEMVPGHYLQLKMAALGPRKARALFGDGVFIEGWGTFSERLMLDLGWGDELAFAAHLKKQLENIARTVVDIRVHTEGMTREEVTRLARDEALQEEQFAANLWRRAITTSPQLTFYWLGEQRVRREYDATRLELGEAFVLRDFTDRLMRAGPIPGELAVTRTLDSARPRPGQR